MSGLLVEGRVVPVTVRRNARASRMSLKVDQDGTVILVLPAHVKTDRGLAFAESQTGWLAERLARVPPAIPFADGMELPLLGRPYRVRHTPLERRGTWAGDGEIHVSGRPEHLARRLGDWLKRRAYAEIDGRARPMAAGIDRTIGAIRLKDTRSRWGSCNARGELAFSWRLLLAPEEVLSYVVAHEVAHLRELNHSAAFWRLVASLVADTQSPRAWLKRHGAELHRYGRT